MKGSETGYEVMERWDGSVHQAGLPSVPATSQHDLMNTMGFMTPAVVEATYYPEEDNRSGFSKDQRNVLCDVRTYGPYSRPLTKVPVLQLRQGLWDEDITIPRAARQNIEGGTLTIAGSGKTPTVAPTRAESMDGDHVMIGFLYNSPRFPVILPFTLGHPKSNAIPKKADGRVKRLRHGGTLMEWSENGDWTLDATEAAKEVLGTKGAETANNGTSGVVTLKTLDGGDDTLRLVLDKNGDVILEAGGASEKLVMDKSAGSCTLTSTSLNKLSSAKTQLSSPLTELSTGPLQPVLKGSAYGSAEATFYSAGLTVPINAALALIGAAMEALTNAQGLSPADIAKVTAANAAGLAAAFGTPNSIALITWATDYAAALSLKVQTG
jgi:hypothetical protein